MTRILVIDNYDSFVYTIVDYLRLHGAKTTVVRNDVVDIDSISSYDGVLVSPGPGTPAAAGQSIAAIEECARTDTPMLGVCLGHQALAEVFGATVSHSPELMHGKTSQITHADRSLLDTLPSPIQVTRYHSLAVEPETVPDDALRVTAATPSGIIMALEHKELPLYGLQFHPESVMTVGGHVMLANWLKVTGDDAAPARAVGKAPLIREA